MSPRSRRRYWFYFLLIMVIPLFSESVYPPLIAAVSPWIKKFPLFNSESPSIPARKKMLAHHNAKTAQPDLADLEMQFARSEITPELDFTPKKNFYPAPSSTFKKEKEFAVVFPEHEPKTVSYPLEWRLEQPFPDNDPAKLAAWKQAAHQQWAIWGVEPELKSSLEPDAKSEKNQKDNKEESEEDMESEPLPPYAFHAYSFKPGLNHRGLKKGVSLESATPLDKVPTIPLHEITARLAGPPDFIGPGSDYNNWQWLIDWKIINPRTGRFINPRTGKDDLNRRTDNGVVSLGHGGEVVLEIEGYLEDAEGVDLLANENAFEKSGQPGNFFIETCVLGVSDSPEGPWVEFDCPNYPPYEGCVGSTPVCMGGNRYELANLPDRPERITYLRLRDSGDNFDPKQEDQELIRNNNEGCDPDNVAILSGRRIKHES